MLCDAYKAKTASERRQHVERHQLCFNCLGRHKISDCPSRRTCSFCDARHHSTLHDAYSSETVKSSLSASWAAKASAVLLATARVRVTDKFGVLHSARALIDQGSEVSIIAESLAQRLQLARSLAATSIVGVGGQPASARGRVEFTLTPLRDGPPLRVSALVLKRLTTYHGGTRVIRKTWPHIDGIELADPDFFAADPVEILLGADVCAAILQPGFRRGGQRQPVAQQTTLGWILSGSVGSSAQTGPLSRITAAATTTFTAWCRGSGGRRKSPSRMFRSPATSRRPKIISSALTRETPTAALWCVSLSDCRFQISRERSAPPPACSGTWSGDSLATSS
ncbi:hypothetical protein ACFW04_012451 [Cataglyphis niger]